MRNWALTRLAGLRLVDIDQCPLLLALIKDSAADADALAQRLVGPDCYLMSWQVAIR